MYLIYGFALLFTQKLIRKDMLYMDRNNILLDNLEKLHTTELGTVRTHPINHIASYPGNKNLPNLYINLFNMCGNNCITIRINSYLNMN